MPSDTPGESSRGALGLGPSLITIVRLNTVYMVTDILGIFYALINYGSMGMVYVDDPSVLSIIGSVGYPASCRGYLLQTTRSFGSRHQHVFEQGFKDARTDYIPILGMWQILTILRAPILLASFILMFFQR